MIHYTDSYNDRIRRVVDNYNRKITRAHKAGYRKRDLPRPVTVKQLKRGYNNRRDLDRELKNLEMFSTEKLAKDPLQKVNKYDLELIEANREGVRKQQLNYARILRSKVAKGMPLGEAEISGYKRRADLFNKDINQLTNAELYEMKQLVENYRDSFSKQSAGYRGFLTEIEFVLNNTGVSPSQRDELLEKLTKLSPEEFFYIYHESDLVERIYDLADSPTYGEMKLNTDVQKARDLVEMLFTQIDGLIKDAKANVNKYVKK